MAYRKLHIDGSVWQYSVGRSNVHIKGPDGVNFNYPTQELGSVVNCSCGPEYNCYSYGKAVKPSDVKKFIKNKIR